MLAEGLSFWSGLFAINLDSDKKLCNDSVPEPCIFNMICIHEGMVIRCWHHFKHNNHSFFGSVLQVLALEVEVDMTTRGPKPWRDSWENRSQQDVSAPWRPTSEARLGTCVPCQR